MKNKTQRSLVFILFTIFFTNTSLAKTLDHKIFLKEIENSGDVIYSNCIKQYDEYIELNPNDISVLIEKCKFIDLAQYDDYEDYNPNQEEFDSCFNFLKDHFPSNPEFLLYKTSYLWGDEQEEAFKEAEESVNNHPNEWSKEMLSELYLALYDHYYWNEEYQEAYSTIQKAIAIDRTLYNSLKHAKVLVKLDYNEIAMPILTSGIDSTLSTWEQTDKAELLLQLKAYDKALEIYNYISSVDSTYNNNSEIAKTFEGLGDHETAREYLVKDTSMYYKKEVALKQILLHDFKYGNITDSAKIYNEYRDFGFKADPLGIYRIKLFFHQPSLPWKFRDTLGILVLILTILSFVIIPYIWILPVYFIGTYWGYKTKNKENKTYWGLKAFWFISFGYLLASLIGPLFCTEYFYSLLTRDSYDVATANLAKVNTAFIVSLAIFGFSLLYKKRINELVSNKWSIGKTVLISLISFFAFKIISFIYIKIGISHLGISADEFASYFSFFLSSKKEIIAILTTYGKLISLIIICILVPIYEEIIFRGVILDSCERYINFRSANLIQAALFGAIHMDLYLFPIFFLFGITTGIIRRKSGGLLGGIVFHAFNNLLALTAIVAKQALL